jgi:hypothetical protein
VRAQQFIDINPPTQGLVANVPPHLVPPTALLDGENIFLDLDGLYKPRFGYAPYLTPGPNIGAVNGLWWWVDLDSSNQYLAVSPTDAATVRNGAWTTITGSPTLNGSLFDPVRFVDYFQNDFINVIICNNHDPLKVWNTSQNTLQPLTPIVPLMGLNAYSGANSPALTAYPQNTQFFFTFSNTNTGAVTVNLNGIGPVPMRNILTGPVTDFTAGQLLAGTIYNFTFDGTEFILGFNLLAPTCRDIAVIGDRVVGINVLNGGVRNFTQMTWTSAFDMTAWPALAFYNFLDSDDPLVAIRNLGQNAGVILGQESGWLAQSVGGVTDPFAFSFSPIRGFTTGPIGTAAVVVAEGLCYFMGTDARIWVTDGSAAWTISQPIDPIVINDIDFSHGSEVVAVYYPKYRHLWWWWPSKSTA